jgi:hypothetical protein
MKIIIGRQSAFGETHRCKFSRWFGLSRGSGLSATVLLIAATMTCSGSSAARDIGSTKRQKTEIPFGLYNGNLIIVKATVGSVKNVNLILDTGTSPTVINQGIADRLNVQGKGALLQTLTGTIHVQSVTLPRIQIGPLHADSITGVVEDLTFLERSLGISLGGIAGLDILRSGSFAIDYHGQKIIFGPIAASEKAVRFENPNSLPIGKGDDRRTGGPLTTRFGDRRIACPSQPVADRAGTTPCRSEWFHIHRCWWRDSRQLAFHGGGARKA